ncbi:AAA family ATPase [Planosporangium thailandense]|uniref:AAA family ATPase n=1 Tax=Planosporangium thailandense TaxID=765197 RepID=A0ABX0XSD4_9ACTN|nr:AAA family ATPase [Planosporangium thailandense]NJC68138.1 AAA family ATPase [Planosporangium thailandense]
MRAAVFGRGDELGRVRELVHRAASGYGATVLVEGEPGIGKSTLLAAAAAEGRRLGARVLRADGVAGQQGSFAAVRSWLAADPPIDPVVTRQPGADGDLVVTELADRDLAVTELVVNRIEAWCAAGPVVAVVDDLQWVDPASLLLLGRLHRSVAQLPLLLVAAYQPTPSDARLDVLLRALHGRGAVPMTLAPLPEDEIAALAQSLLGAPAGPELRELLARAGGNPLYAIHLLGALARTGGIRVAGGYATPRRGGAAAVPGTLIGLIQRRLDRLSDPTVELLRAAAVLGAGFDLTELAAVLDTPVISLWEPASEAVTAGLLVEAGDQLVFRHELVRQVLADNLSGGAADALRLRAGRALATAGARVERVARHLTAATGLAPDLVDWLARAAEALVVRAPDLATPLLERTLRQRRGEVPETLRLQYARALLWAGRPADATEAVQAALSAEPKPGVALRWLLAQSRLQSGELDAALAVAEKVLADEGLSDEDAARFHALAAQCLLLTGRAKAAEAAAAPAVAGSDDYVNACALTALAGVRLVRQRPADGLDLADRALAALGGDQVQPDHPFAPHLVRGFCLLELGRFDEADAAFGQGRTRGDRAFLAWHRLGSARVRYLEGRWDDALTEIRAGLEATDHLGVAPALRSQATLIGLHRGDGPDPDVREHDDPSPYWGWLRASARALSAERDGDRDRALRTLSDAWGRGPALACLAAELARVAGCGGRRSQVRGVAEPLYRVAVHHGGPQVRAAALLCRGIVEADAAVLLTAAQTFNEARRPLYEGYAYEEAADVLATTGARARARAALDAALGCYDRIGAAWDLERAQARLREAGVRHRSGRQRPTTGWEALTRTERRIVELVVAGRSNPDIAAELYLSPRTVRNHVSHILAKLGLSSRVELAVSAYEQGAR